MLVVLPAHGPPVNTTRWMRRVSSAFFKDKFFYFNLFEVNGNSINKKGNSLGDEARDDLLLVVELATSLLSDELFEWSEPFPLRFSVDELALFISLLMLLWLLWLTNSAEFILIKLSRSMPSVSIFVRCGTYATEKVVQTGTSKCVRQQKQRKKGL